MVINRVTRPRAARHRLAELSLLVSLGCTPALLQAQEAEAAASTEEPEPETVIVTGTRASGLDEFSSSSPVQVLNAAELEIGGPARSHEFPGKRGAVLYRAGFWRRHGEPDAAGEAARPESQPHAGARERQTPSHHLEPGDPRRSVPGRRQRRPQFHSGRLHRSHRGAYRGRGRPIRHGCHRRRHQHHHEAQFLGRECQLFAWRALCRRRRYHHLQRQRRFRGHLRLVFQSRPPSIASTVTPTAATSTRVSSTRHGSIRRRAAHFPTPTCPSPRGIRTSTRSSATRPTR